MELKQQPAAEPQLQLSVVKKEVADQLAAMKTELSGQITTNHEAVNQSLQHANQAFANYQLEIGSKITEMTNSMGATNTALQNLQVDAANKAQEVDTLRTSLDDFKGQQNEMMNILKSLKEASSSAADRDDRPKKHKSGTGSGDQRPAGG